MVAGFFSFACKLYIYLSIYSCIARHPPVVAVSLEGTLRTGAVIAASQTICTILITRLQKTDVNVLLLSAIPSATRPVGIIHQIVCFSHNLVMQPWSQADVFAHRRTQQDRICTERHVRGEEEEFYKLLLQLLSHGIILAVEQQTCCGIAPTCRESIQHLYGALADTTK